MGFTPEQVEDLKAKLNPDHIASREQSGRKLSYIEGWHAIAEANRILGHDGWSRETVECRSVAEHPRKVGKGQYTRDGWGVSYIARVRVTVFAGDRTIIREGSGTGHGIDADLGLAHESAIKEAETDAMKRALSTLGWPFGLALYDKSQENVGRDEPAKAAPTPASAQPGDDNPFPAEGEGLDPTVSAEKRVELIELIDQCGSCEALDDWKRQYTADTKMLLPRDRDMVFAAGKRKAERFQPVNVLAAG